MELMEREKFQGPSGELGWERSTMWKKRKKKGGEYRVDHDE
jgi:hypothetical protein